MKRRPSPLPMIILGLGAVALCVVMFLTITNPRLLGINPDPLYGEVLSYLREHAHDPSSVEIASIGAPVKRSAFSVPKILKVKAFEDAPKNAEYRIIVFRSRNGFGALTRSEAMAVISQGGRVIAVVDSSGWDLSDPATKSPSNRELQEAIQQISSEANDAVELIEGEFDGLSRGAEPEEVDRIREDIKRRVAVVRAEEAKAVQKARALAAKP